MRVGHAGPIEEARVGGEKEKSRRGDSGGSVCVCMSVNGKGGWGGGGVYKMEIYDRDTVASFSLHTGNN